MSKLHTHHIAIAACRTTLADPAKQGLVRIVPAGYFKARDGRPANIVKGWYLDGRNIQSVLAALKAKQDDLVVDYEHQTLYADKNGQPAPAAGWIKPDSFQWFDDDGLYAQVAWTAKASASIDANEYKYFSPVIAYAADGAVLSIEMGALVNHAAIDGLDSLAQLAAAKFTFQQHEGNTVDKDELIALLGLPADSDEAAIKAALQALKEKAAASDGEAAALKATVAALKSQNAPDLSQFVPKAVHEETRTQLAALKANSDKGEVEALIKEGLDDGRIAGAATAQWLREQGMAALKAHLADAPSIAALKATQTQGKQPGDANTQLLSVEEIAVCKAMGMDEKAFLRARDA